ncbi:cytochrome P450 4c3-like [Atheta coriaria]
MDKLRENVGKLSFNVQDLISLCTLDIINETAMGISVNAQLNANTDYVNAIKVLTHIVTERGIKIYKHFDLLYFFTKDYRIEKKCLKIVHNYSLSVIESRRKELQKNSESNSFNPNAIDEFGRRKRIAFLDLLLQSTIDGQPLTDEDIREEVDTFMFEGHDTTASGISFWLHLISKHPEIQEKLILEQQNIFGDDPFRPTTLSDLQNMNYMEMTIKETLRLYPSVPMMLRDCIQDIKFRDMTFKKGTQLLIFPFYLHRRPDIFPDPEKFIPERFQAENINKRHAFSYLAFSAGSRNCIGQKFAMLEMKCILGKILRNFEIHPSYPAHEVKIQADIIIASKNGYRIQLKHRK